MEPLEVQAKFKDKFEPLLGNTHRWAGFSYIADALISKNKSINIVETGCTHTQDWKGHGCSTIIWDWFVQNTGGTCTTVDLSEPHIGVCKTLCPNVNAVYGESITTLLSLDLSKTDLLFLDSYDHNPPYGLSELHAVGELAASYERLPSGCLIAVDDCNPDGTGKHNFINVFFKRMGISPVSASYIYVWRKP
jgi:hypothetical protein